MAIGASIRGLVSRALRGRVVRTRPAGLLRAACAAAIVLCVFGAGPAHAAVVRKVALADLSGFRLEFEAGVSERNLVTVTGNPLVL